ncbi:aasdhppt [Symbiodinium pilosum]|uniref:Aasdhppt protein n=1 Tax=Symbiodinium pilosum TaxID=2952 RepID=A0A812VBP1_SYMPI|nr:aasdhppt [Symbiodinium pilosum]
MERVEIHIDGWPRPDWTVYQEELAGSWISVAFGPVDEAVDANGTFRATFRLPGLGGPSDLEALKSSRAEHAELTASLASRWTPQAGGFQTISVDALLPQEAKEQLTIIRGRNIAAAAGV